MSNYYFTCISLVYVIQQYIHRKKKISNTENLYTLRRICAALKKLKNFNRFTHFFKFAGGH